MPIQTETAWLRSLVLIATAVAALSSAPGAQSLEQTTRLIQYDHRSWPAGDAGLMGTPQSIAQTRDGYIRVSTENGLYRFDGMRFRKWNPKAGESLPSASLWYLFGGRDGSLYVGTDRGLARIRGGHVYTYPGSPRWPGPFVEDRDGGLWMGVSGSASDAGAICKIGEESLRCFGVHGGFTCARRMSNMASPDGYLWVGGTEGICRWKPGNPPAAEILTSLLRRKGLSRVTGLASVAGGEHWAGLELKGSGAGLLHLENGRWRSYETPTIDGRNLAVSAPDHYVFHVTAYNNDGVFNWRGAELAFTIPPARYETLWFRILAMLLFVIVGPLGYVYRLQRYARVLKQRFDERLQERTRLARDLHDTLLQTIQGSKIVADEAKDHVEDARLTGRSLDRLSEWLDRASVEGRAALEALRSSSIESNDLAGALHRVAGDCTPGARMTVNISTVGSVREMHPIARDEVYRIAHEAIRNACAHSGGNHLWIELRYKKRFHLKVRDNGHGVGGEILKSGKPGHFGLAGMRERALFMGGNLHIGSSPHGGTVVSVVIPGQAIYKYPSDGHRAWLVDILRRKSPRKI